MKYVNCGAYVRGSRPKTKKELKQAMKDNPDQVHFDSTEMFHPGGCTGTTIPTDTTMMVIGPDPFTKRTWYASVTSDGKVK
jgi:hypothetical protein